MASILIWCLAHLYTSPQTLEKRNIIYSLWTASVSISISSYVSHVRSFVYDFIVITKYKITNTTDISECLNICPPINVTTSIVHAHACPHPNIHTHTHTFPIYVTNDQLQLCTHLSSDEVKQQQYQRWYHPLIQIICPKDVLSHTQTTSNQTGWDLESRKFVPPPPSPNIVLDLHIMVVMRCCTVLEQNGTMLKHFWLFTVNSQPQIPCKLAQ
jgi:hypothetical protein